MSSPSSQVRQFLDKLEELRSVFVLGRRSIPFLEELFCFVQDVTVLMEEVNAAIHSHTGDMPRATSQLRSVSKATELATNEILDLVDEVLHQLRGLEEDLQTSRTCFEGFGEADDRLLALLQEELGEEQADLLAQVKRLSEEKRDLREEGRGELATARKSISHIRGKVNHIMMSLQVQDITAQQIASANHLIESIRQRMDMLLKDLGSGRVSRENEPADAPRAATAFDANARYERSPARQRMADELVSFMSRDGSDHEDGPQDKAAAPPDSEAAGSSPSRSESATGGQEAASQFDIDEMFANYGRPDGEASPDDPGRAPAHGPADEPADAASSGDDGQGGTGEAASPEDIERLFQQGL